MRFTTGPQDYRLFSNMIFNNESIKGYSCSIKECYCVCTKEIDQNILSTYFYRAHKRMSYGWKVNYGYANVREDIEVSPKYKMWVDEIYKTYPDFESFCIDTIVGKNGKEYILEIKGSSQGFQPEHEQEAFIKFRELVMRKLDLLSENEPKENDKESEPLLESDIDLEILNLKNDKLSLETKLSSYKKRIEDLKKTSQQLQLQQQHEQEKSQDNPIKLNAQYIFSIAMIIITFLWKTFHKS